MALNIAGKVFFAFCLILLVVLGLGLWSLHATRQLQVLNQTLLTQALPAARMQIALREQIPTLMRHETRAIVLKDPAYQALHRREAEEFEARLQRLAKILDGHAPRQVLEEVRARFTDYLGLVEREWEAVGRGKSSQALRLSEGPTRDALEALEASLERLLVESRADLEQKVEAAGRLDRAARIVTSVSLAISLAVGLGLAWMVAVRIARPIRALSRATQLIARGEYDLPITVRSRDEVGELAQAFREMAEKLREMDALKEQFFSNISHEIRSPLWSIQMATGLLRENPADPLGPKQEALIEIIRSDAEKILRLTALILALSRLRSGRLQLDLAESDLRRIVEDAAQEVRPSAEAKQITLTVALPDPSPQLVCDEDRIQQVLTNLLMNAVKFTPAGGQVVVTGREEGGELIITVEDTGVGIPTAQLPYVFEPYHQAHPGRDGIGLGLAIVKGFVEAHGGRVWAESREGEGSRFHVALPRAGRAR